MANNAENKIDCVANAILKKRRVSYNEGEKSHRRKEKLDNSQDLENNIRALI